MVIVGQYNKLASAVSVIKPKSSGGGGFNPADVFANGTGLPDDLIAFGVSNKVGSDNQLIYESINKKIKIDNTSAQIQIGTDANNVSIKNLNSEKTIESTNLLNLKGSVVSLQNSATPTNQVTWNGSILQVNATNPNLVVGTVAAGWIIGQTPRTIASSGTTTASIQSGGALSLSSSTQTFITASVLRISTFGSPTTTGDMTRSGDVLNFRTSAAVSVDLVSPANQPANRLIYGTGTGATSNNNYTVSTVGAPAITIGANFALALNGNFAQVFNNLPLGNVQIRAANEISLEYAVGQSGVRVTNAITELSNVTNAAHKVRVNGAATFVFKAGQVIQDGDFYFDLANLQFRCRIAGVTYRFQVIPA